MNSTDNTPALAPVSLDDKYVALQGAALLSGMQALVRLPLVLHERARQTGQKIGGYISGYRGSPVGTYDLALGAAQAHLAARDIVFQPGVNEELAATAVWGSQQVHLLGHSRFDGVFGLWYGKSPGVDRSLDVFRHANYAGTSPHGGVLAIAGDDPNAVSSTVTGCSDQAFAAVGMPVLYPASVQDMLDFGVLGIALSHYSGCWVALKAVTDIAESSAIVDLDINRVNTDWLTAPGLLADDVSIRWPDNRVEQERRLYETKLARVRTFARESGINRLTVAPDAARWGIVSAGKPWADLMQALQDLGLTEADVSRLGLRVLKLGLIYPLDEAQIRAFAQGLDTLLVVEEKRGFIEDQIKSLLFGQNPCPQVLGKHDSAGLALIAEHGETSPARLAQVLCSVFPTLAQAPAAQARLALLQAKSRPLTALPAARTPFFCSGCPHNSSTKVPEGSLALAGIGCHWLALFMDRQTVTFTQMGGEGANWLGAMGFSAQTHVFANLGDGTYHHSGVLAVRAAVHAKANITYKLLYNDAVAMTGGQRVSDTFSPQQIASQLLAEGVVRLVVVSDQPEKYQQTDAPNGGFAAGVSLHGRDELDALQRELRQTKGVTVLLYDQTCAAEKRRRRKRGTLADPDVRAFINPAVCEGCGDCSVQSNCIAVEPLPTDKGRKRQINQSACNKDILCVEGFCPSFVTLHGAVLKKVADLPQSDRLELPPLPVPVPCALAGVHETVITGIGGTGVITLGAILAMAAHLEGRAATCLDQTGIAQKNGAVLSHIRIAPAAAELHTPRIATANADLLLGCDMRVAASAAALDTLAAGHTQVVLNAHLAPHAAFVLNPVRADFDADGLRMVIDAAAGADQVHALDATRIATQVFGDALAANMILLGYALQKGWLPVSLAALVRAIEINATAVTTNLCALDWGRQAAQDLPGTLRRIGPAQPVTVTGRRADSVVALIDRLAAELRAYQDEAYAKRFTDLLQKVQQAEQQAQPGIDSLTRAVALQAFRLMAYKDEYEVARLYTDGRFEQHLKAQFDGDIRLQFHLAPPLLARRDPLTGHLKKQTFGPWVLTAMRGLARLKGLRGGRFDLFGKTVERRTERQLATLYPALMGALLPTLTAANHAEVLALACIAEEIRGFGHIKARQLALAVHRWREACQHTPAAAIVLQFVAQLETDKR